MKENMSELFLCVLFLSLINFSRCGVPYANNYPYQGHGSLYSGGSSTSDTEGGADISTYLKNQLRDKSNDAKASLDTGKFYNTENASKGHEINQLKQGAVSDTQKHTVGENVETDKSHNRKQIKSGFQNSYHKDESGSNSSFYEDSDDHDGKLIYNKKHRHGGDEYDSKYNEGLRDGSVRDRLDDRHAGYDTRGSHDRERDRAENQGNRQGHRDGYNRGQGERFEKFDDRSPYESPYNYNNGESYGLYRPVENHGLYRGQFSEYDRQPITSGFNSAYSSRFATQSYPTSHSLNDDQDDGYFSRGRITIYDDPRENIDPRTDRRGDYGRRDFDRDDIYHAPRLDIRPSPTINRNYDEFNRDSIRYRDF